MRFVWSFHSLPELHHLDEGQRRTLIAGCVDWRTRMLLVARSLAIGWIGGFTTYVLLNHWLTHDIGLVAGAVILILAGAAWFQFEMLRIRAALRLYLNEAFEGERLPACLSCGYDLRGTTGNRCPECGANVILPGRSGAKSDESH